MSTRTKVLGVVGTLLVLLSLYSFGGVLQAAMLFTGAKAVRNFNLWASLSLMSFAFAAYCLFLVWPACRRVLSQMRPAALALIGTVSVFLAVVVTWPVIEEFLEIDRCLDSGGSFDYVRSLCDAQQNHRYLPLADRQGFRIITAFVFAVLGVAMFLAARHASRRRLSAL